MTVSQIKGAAAEYIDTEFAAKIPGIGKWVVGMGAAAYISQMDALVEKNLGMLVQLGYAQEDGQIDVDKLYQDMHTQATKYGKIVQNIPLLGEVTFSVDDIEKFYKICREEM